MLDRETEQPNPCYPTKMSSLFDWSVDSKFITSYNTNYLRNVSTKAFRGIFAVFLQFTEQGIQKLIAINY